MKCLLLVCGGILIGHLTSLPSPYGLLAAFLGLPLGWYARGLERRLERT